MPGGFLSKNRPTSYIADSKATSASSRASAADSKALSVSLLDSASNSKGTSAGTQASSADSKGVSSGTQASTSDSKAVSDSVLTSTADSKATSVGTANLSGTAATSATTGTMTVNMTTACITITPTGACTFNAGASGTAGQTVAFTFTTSGISGFIMTFGTNYRPNGTLTLSTTTAKKQVVWFVSDGSTWNETTRSAVL